MTPIVTGKVRFNYVNVFEPREPQGGGDPKYSITLLIPKTDAATKQAIDTAIQQVINDSISTTFGGVRPPASNLPIHDGDGLRPSSGAPFGAECKGHWVMTASSKQRPEVVDDRVQPILDRSQICSGDYGRVSLRFYAYNKAGRKGIGCGLGNVQKLADGEPLDGRTSATDDFGATKSTSSIDPITGQPIDMDRILGGW